MGVPTGKKSEWFWWYPDRGKARGSSSLTLFEAETCLLPAPCKARAGRKNLNLVCGDCTSRFIPRI